MCVQLADSTIRYPKGIAEHIFVRVRDSFIIADLVVMDMEGHHGVDLILGRPFLRSAKARIDVVSTLLSATIYVPQAHGSW